MKIYIATHKEFVPPVEEIYVPLLVGANKNINNVSQGLVGEYLKDNVGDHISNKNPNYCELTGLYWMWKNEKVETIGLVHYRRYFTKFFGKKVLNEKEIINLLRGVDIILPQPYYFRKDTVWSDYVSRHSDEELILCKKILEEQYPDYVDTFDKVFAARKFYTFNMFVTSKELFDQYCEWLFDILIQIENEIDISDRDNYNQRMYGFLSERLFNVWIMKKNLAVKEVMVKNTESSNSKEYFKNQLKKTLNYGG